MELHQNEVRQLKNDLNCIGVRMDYQYNDRFNKIEESVEAVHNRVLIFNFLANFFNILDDSNGDKLARKF